MLIYNEFCSPKKVTMKKESLVWLYLALVFLVLSLVSAYFSVLFVSIIFLGIALLNLIILFFDCQRNELCRFLSSAFTQSLSIFFLLLFTLAIVENFYAFIPEGIVRAAIVKFTWAWPILFILFLPISKLFGKIVKAQKN